jgi:hypothetical protein
MEAWTLSLDLPAPPLLDLSRLSSQQPQGQICFTHFAHEVVRLLQEVIIPTDDQVLPSQGVVTFVLTVTVG